jgi:hypothetical protein
MKTVSSVKTHSSLILISSPKKNLKWQFSDFEIFKTPEPEVLYNFKLRAQHWFLPCEQNKLTRKIHLSYFKLC